mgnify:CR=1 FL=1
MLHLTYQQLIIMILSVANPKWQNVRDFSNLKNITPYAVLKPTLCPLFQRITAHLMLVVSFCGPVVGLWCTQTAIA